MSSIDTPAIGHAEYDPQPQELTIICHDGSSTIYVAVPQTIYGELRRAPDKQEFLRSRVQEHFSGAGLGDQP